MDESGHDHRNMPYEVRGGVAIHAARLWPFIQAVNDLEVASFGCNLRDYGSEIKGYKLADKDRWRWAAQDAEMSDSDRRTHATNFLKASREGRTPRRFEFTAYGQACVNMGRGIFRLLDEAEAVILASFIPKSVKRPSTFEATEYLRKDHVFLFQRYYWLLDEHDETGLIVMDRCEHNLDGHFVDQMVDYFTRSTNGQVRSTRIMPYPFFVDSHLVSPVQVADFCIYCLNFGFRLPSRGLDEPARQDVVDEFRPWLDKLQFQGRSIDGGQEHHIYGYCFVPDPYNGR